MRIVIIIPTGNAYESTLYFKIASINNGVNIKNEIALKAAILNSCSLRHRFKMARLDFVCMNIFKYTLAKVS